MNYKRLFILNLLALFTSLALCEVALQLNSELKFKIESSFFTQDEDIGYISRNLKDKISKEQNQSQIVLSGSSVTNTFSKQMKALCEVQGCFFESQKISVIDTGVPGYNIRQNQIFLKKYLSKLKPAMLLQEINYKNNFKWVPFFSQNEAGETQIYNLGKWQFLGALSFLNQLKVYQFFIAEFIPFALQREAQDIDQQIFESLQAIQKQALEAHIQFDVLVIPPFSSNLELVDGYHQRVLQILKNLNLQQNTIDLFTAFKDLNLENFRYSRSDEVHPNADGIDMMVQEIFKNIKVLKTENK